MALNDAAIRALKPKDRVFAVADSHGLCIEVAVSGSKLWRFRYRYGGRARNLSFGRYPEVSLEEARKRRDEARSVLRDGVDPGTIITHRLSGGQPSMMIRAQRGRNPIVRGTIEDFWIPQRSEGQFGTSGGHSGNLLP